MDTGSPAHSLTRADLAGLRAKPLRTGAVNKADLLLYRIGDENVLLKDYSRKPGLWRSVVGRVLTRRESRALRELVGVQGVPQFRGRPDRYSFLMTFRPVERARAANLPGDRLGFVRELERIVREMHGRGVVHLGLKHRTNVTVAADGSAMVLDFESAVCFSPRWWGGRLAVRLLGQLDWLAVQNWKRRLCPESLTEDERRRAKWAKRLRGAYLPRRFIGAIVDIYQRTTRGPLGR